jgi:hypothetical protein
VGDCLSVLVQRSQTTASRGHGRSPLSAAQHANDSRTSRTATTASHATAPEAWISLLEMPAKQDLLSCRRYGGSRPAPQPQDRSVMRVQVPARTSNTHPRNTRAMPGLPRETIGVVDGWLARPTLRSPRLRLAPTAVGRARHCCRTSGEAPVEAETRSRALRASPSTSVWPRALWRLWEQRSWSSF